MENKEGDSLGREGNLCVGNEPPGGFKFLRGGYGKGILRGHPDKCVTGSAVKYH